MRRLKAEYRVWEGGEKYVETLPSEKQILKTDVWLEPPVIVTYNGAPVLVAMKPDDADTLALLAEALDASMAFPWATYGLRRMGVSRNYKGGSFGAVTPVVPMKRLAVSMSVLATRHAEYTALLHSLIDVGWGHLRETCRSMWLGFDAAERAHADWLIGDTPYTSCIVNADSAAPLHRDTGNVELTGSLMWVMRQKTTGGHLWVPELQALLRCDHGLLLAFYGEELWHGCTRIKNLGTPGAHRYSLVAYARKQIAEAGSYAQEHRKAAQLGTKLGDKFRTTVLAPTQAEQRWSKYI